MSYTTYSMVNLEKIKLMSDLTLYENREGRQNSVTNSYFKSDFISRHMLGSFFSYTICYFFFMVLVLLYKLEEILDSNDLLETFKSFKPYIIYYVAGLAIYELITIIVYARRYNHAQRALRMENAKLRRIEKRYELDEKNSVLGGK